jgi:pilus assembly protein FimV
VVVAAAPPPPVDAPPPAQEAAAPNTPVETAPAADLGIIASLLDRPVALVGAGALAFLLAGLGYWGLRGRKKRDGGETSFLESRLQPDSFFGASGGQRIDTRDATGSPSSMSYSLSQLDAIGDVDPVAEADVYLAYGRDLQAEEILKEAMRSNPDRLAIRTKLLEVYAKRRDTKGFELLATQLYGLTSGQGDDWGKAQELGRTIDPDNPLYQPGGRPAQATPASGASSRDMMGVSTMPQSVVPSPSRFQASSVGGDSEAGAVVAPDSSMDLDLDISQLPDLDDPRNAGLPAPATARATAAKFNLPDLPTIPPARTAPAATSGFDMGGISLNLDASAPGGLQTDRLDSAPAGDGSPLVRKMELAEEFRQIGDMEGARDLLQEVADKASGALRAKAQSMLDSLV